MNARKVVKVEEIKTDAEKIACPVERSHYLVSEFLTGPMCGRCFPCSMGSYEARLILEHIMNGTSSISELERLGIIADTMLRASMCKKGKDIAGYIKEWLDQDVFERHLQRVCPGQTCKAFIEYRIIPGKCTMCGDCLSSCKYNAILGEKVKPLMSGYHPFEIREKKCIKCGECIKVCKYDAIILVSPHDRSEAAAVGV